MMVSTGKVLFDFNDETQRKRWSNLPSGAFQRAGLRMGDLTAQRREAALAVLASALSKQGYEKVLQIIEADETLRATEGRGAAARVVVVRVVVVRAGVAGQAVGPTLDAITITFPFSASPLTRRRG